MTTRTAPPLSERDFQTQLTQLAELRGWEWVHTRNARTMDSWRTPMSGTMARGFPDLVLSRKRDRRLLFIECKTDTGQLTPEQERVLDILRSLDSEWIDEDGLRIFDVNRVPAPRVETLVLRPRLWPLIEDLLR